jgi:hypothetical protein
VGNSVWDKGFLSDYFDNERVDRKSVRLEGRRETASVILDMELVDLVHSLPSFYFVLSIFSY